MTATTELRATQRNGEWVVIDDGAVWWPEDDAQAIIAASDDPEQTAVDMCRDEPMMGEWRS